MPFRKGSTPPSEKQGSAISLRLRLPKNYYKKTNLGRFEQKFSNDLTYHEKLSEADYFISDKNTSN